MTSFLVGSVVNASVETRLMGPLTVFATLALLEIPSPSVLVRSTFYDSNSANTAVTIMVNTNFLRCNVHISSRSVVS